jgi:hypothetical protein
VKQRCTATFAILLIFFSSSVKTMDTRTGEETEQPSNEQLWHDFNTILNEPTHSKELIDLVVETWLKSFGNQPFSQEDNTTLEHTIAKWPGTPIARQLILRSFPEMPIFLLPIYQKKQKLPNVPLEAIVSNEEVCGFTAYIIAHHIKNQLKRNNHC